MRCRALASALALLTTRAQYAEFTEKYSEVLSAETTLLQEQLRSNEFVEEIFHPDRAGPARPSQSGQTERAIYFDPDVFHVEAPHAQLYAMGMILDPCKSNAFDCCASQFGTPVYGRLKRALVDLGSRSQAEKQSDPMLLADADEIFANVDWVDADGADVPLENLRRADDETFIDDACAGVRRGLGLAGVDKPYTLGANGKLTKTDAFTHCQGERRGHRAYPTQPACIDNNATVNASAPCLDLAGAAAPNCVQVGITQTAIIITCGKSASRNEKDYSADAHCGTFLEIHRDNGSPYNPDENFILSEKRIDVGYTTGYTTTTIDLTYGIGEADKILCSYEEADIRLGSMVFIKASAPECCCPEAFNNEVKTGQFFCPKNAYDDTAGAFATALNSLPALLTFNTTVDVYPYCPAMPGDEDKILCSTNYTTRGGVDRPFAYECPAVSEANATSGAGRGSDFLVGSYPGQCFFFAGCGSRPQRTGPYGAGDATSAAADTANKGCAQACGDASCARDAYFAFNGLVGKVTCAPSDEAACVVYDGDKFEDDEKYYLVSFNDGRTSYPFRATDLQLHHSKHNYQLWWVQRTRNKFVVQEKKGFRVSHPKCTFDAVNDRYFPYTKVNADGTFVDTYYG
ncbi:hypothetical protein M885DRAFT_545625 [Pelagophyceae sp. CCMP2097]|nr:hypothetical protein M885DRAFT_545625 [Pelagophyceae sp. CCMP2097]|mmetsp:Transcript_30536/g.102983  ORF Transcript_30536/g.102983 Transcript_30536/m.102983 type:complete len:630 (+) Transcript_30536:58-1947(+)